MRLGRGWPVFTSVPYNGDVRQQVIHHICRSEFFDSPTERRNAIRRKTERRRRYVERLNVENYLTPNATQFF
jgi:hypothetical protein